MTSTPSPNQLPSRGSKQQKRHPIPPLPARRNLRPRTLPLRPEPRLPPHKQRSQPHHYLLLQRTLRSHDPASRLLDLWHPTSRRGFQSRSSHACGFQWQIARGDGTERPGGLRLHAVERCAYDETRVEGVNGAFGGSTGFEFYVPPSGYDVNWQHSAAETYEVVVEKMGRLLGFRRG